MLHKIFFPLIFLASLSQAARLNYRPRNTMSLIIPPPVRITANETHFWVPSNNNSVPVPIKSSINRSSDEYTTEAPSTSTVFSAKDLIEACTAPLPMAEMQKRSGGGDLISFYETNRRMNDNRWKSERISSSQWPNTEQPWNIGFLFVPQQQAWVIERMGKFDRILKPGLNFAVPFIDKVEYVRSLKEFAIDIPTQHAVTKDNVVLVLDAILYLRIVDPLRASYGVHDPEFAVTQLAQTTMRSELGKITLDNIFHERERLNMHIVNTMNVATASWGICCLRYEIRDIELPPKIKAAMEMEVEAERKRRAQILASQGTREAEINVSEGKKMSRILASEAEKQESINHAEGRAEAVIAESDARAKGLEAIGKALSGQHGHEAASLMVAQEYVAAFKEMAKSSTTMLLPNDASNISGMVTQAMSIYNGLPKNREN